MIEIAVGSQNPTKLSAVEMAAKEIFTEPYNITGFKVESGVSDQPMSDEEMIEGAINRAYSVSYEMRTAKYAVGLEGGIRVLPHGWFDLGWVCFLDVDIKNDALAATSALELPKPVQELMESSDLELSEAVAQVYGTNTTQDRDCSAVITNGLMPADKLYSHAVTNAYAGLQNNISNLG